VLLNSSNLPRLYVEELTVADKPEVAMLTDQSCIANDGLLGRASAHPRRAASVKQILLGSARSRRLPARARGRRRRCGEAERRPQLSQAGPCKQPGGQARS